MPLSATTIATAIAAISVPGVTVKNINTFADANYSRDVPLFMPNPENWLSGSTSTLQSFGLASTRFWLVDRTFSYIYLHAQVGSTRTLSDVFTALAANMDLIWESLLELDIPDIDVVSVSWNKPSTVTDPSGAQFIGINCEIGFREKVNA
jgi:hypothetical protein